MKTKPKQGAGLHQFIAAGGKPKAYQGTKGITPQTVPTATRTQKGK